MADPPPAGCLAGAAAGASREGLEGANPVPGEGPTEATPGEAAALGIGCVQESLGALKPNGGDRYWGGNCPPKHGGCGWVATAAEAWAGACPGALPVPTSRSGVRSPQHGSHNLPGGRNSPRREPCGAHGVTEAEKGSRPFTGFSDTTKMCLQHQQNLPPGWRRWVKGETAVPK